MPSSQDQKPGHDEKYYEARYKTMRKRNESILRNVIEEHRRNAPTFTVKEISFPIPRPARVNAFYIACEDKLFPGTWRAEPENYDGRGFVDLFYGKNAQKKAIAAAEARNLRTGAKRQEELKAMKDATSKSKAVKVIVLCLAGTLAAAAAAQTPHGVDQHHEVAETLMYQKVELYHELMPFRASRQIKKDYWKAVNCYAKFTAYKVPDCDKEFAKIEQDLRIE